MSGSDLDRESGAEAGADVDGAHHVRAAAAALKTLATVHPDAAAMLARLVAVIADEASRSQRFARALAEGVVKPNNASNTSGVSARSPAGRSRTGRPTGTAIRPANRRSLGPFDPFAVHAESGEDGLRWRLETLSLEQLRDILAEHGFDNDRLAMKWKDPARVVERIIDRVVSRAAKGSAFREHPTPPGAAAPLTDKRRREVQDLARTSPRAAVLQCYAEVEGALRTLLREVEPEATHGSGDLAALTHRHGLIDDATVKSVEGLYVLRNLASHDDGRLTVERALEYVALTDGTLFAIRQGASGRASG